MNHPKSMFQLSGVHYISFINPQAEAPPSLGLPCEEVGPDEEGGLGHAARSHPIRFYPRNSLRV